MKIVLPTRLWRIAFLLASGAVAAYLFYLVRSTFPPFIVGAVMAYILLPPVKFLENHGLARSGAILLVYAGLAAASLSLGLYGLPALLQELTFFMEAIPRYTADLYSNLERFTSIMRQGSWPDSIRDVFESTMAEGENLIVRQAEGLAHTLVGLASLAPGLVIAPVLTYYLLKDRELVAGWLLRIIPTRSHAETLAIWSQVDEVLWRFIRGHLVIALIVGLIVGLGLTILGVDFPLTLGIVAGLAEIIPYFGPIVGSIPIVAIAWLKSGSLALYTALFLLVVQQLESSILAPRILAESVGLHPLVVIFALLAGAKLGGVVGLLAAVPAVAIGRVLFRYLVDRLLPPPREPGH